jgi:hypothetical protein
MSLEYEFIWIIDADNAHLVEEFLIDMGSAKFNSSKIVPLITFEEILKKSSAQLES